VEKLMVVLARCLILSAALIALPAIAAAQPPEPPPIQLQDLNTILPTPAGTASNLIVYVHGCCTNDGDVTALRDKLWTAFKDQPFVNGDWEIVLWPWTEDTPKPQSVLDNINFEEFARAA